MPQPHNRRRNPLADLSDDVDTSDGLLAVSDSESSDESDEALAAPTAGPSARQQGVSRWLPATGRSISAQQLRRPSPARDEKEVGRRHRTANATPRWTRDEESLVGGGSGTEKGEGTGGDRIWLMRSGEKGRGGGRHSRRRADSSSSSSESSSSRSSDSDSSEAPPPQYRHRERPRRSHRRESSDSDDSGRLKRRRRRPPVRVLPAVVTLFG